MDAKVEVRMFAPCQFLYRGVDENKCKAFSRVPSKNRDGCEKSFCRSPWRLCAACVREDGPAPNVVAKPGERLCNFHHTHGEEVKRGTLVKDTFALKPAPKAVVPKEPTVPELPTPSAKDEATAVSMLAKPDDEVVPEFDLDACAQKYAGLTPYNRRNLEYLLRGEPVPTWGSKSVKSKLSSMLSLVGVPTSDRSRKFNRLRLLQRVVDRVKEMGLELAETQTQRSVSPQSPQDSKPEEEVQYDLDECAKRIPSLTSHQHHLIKKMLKYGTEKVASLLGLQVVSVESHFSTICTKIGIPKTYRSSTLSRESILRKVWAHYNKLVAEGIIPAGHPSEKEQMIEAQHLFWELTPEKKIQALDYLRALQAGG